jgi:hypothetical protein
MGARLALTRDRSTLALAALVAAVALLATSSVLSGFAGAPLYLIPPLLLLSAVAMRRYPGERTLLALIARARRAPIRARAGRLLPRARLRALLPRGGRLLACSLAVRPPPGSFSLT